MNSYRGTWMCLALAVAAFVAASLAYSDGAQASDPRALLEKLVARELAARSFQMSADWKMSMSFLGQQMGMGLRTEVAYRNPNFFRAHFAETEMGDDGKPKPGDVILAVCDGKQFFVDATRDGKRHIVVAPAPADLLKTPLNDIVGMGASANPEGDASVPDFLSVKSGVFDLAKVKSVTADFDRTDAWLKTLKEPPGCVAMTVQLQTGPPFVLWIDPRDLTLRQVALTLSAPDEPAAPGGGKSDALHALAEMFKAASMHMLITADKVVYDEPIARDTFAYKPPTGMTVVKVKSVNDIETALEPPKPIQRPTEQGPPKPRATKPHPQTEAWKMLDEVVATYRSARTYVEVGTVHDETAYSDERQVFETPYKIVYAAPNRAYFQGGSRDNGKLLVCDGTTLYAYARSLGISKIAAPATLRTDFLGDFFVKVPNQGPNFFDCLTGTFDAGEVTSVKMGLPRGKPWIAKLPRPAGTTPLTLDTSVIWGTGPLVVWVDQRTHIIRQWASEGPGEERPPSAGPGQPTARSRSSYTRWYATAQRIAINGAVPAETFAFKPPAGVKVVEAKDSHWMMRAILGMEGEEPSGGEPSASAEAEKNFEGKAPIDFTAIDLDGKPVALSSFKGKPVVLDFWATWCPPCRAELPLLEEAYAKLKAQGLEVVAVAVDETVDDVKKFLQDNKLSFTVLWLDGSTPEGKRVSSEYGVTAIPRTLYIGPDWVIKSDTTGLHEKSEIYKALSSIGLKTD